MAKTKTLQRSTLTSWKDVDDHLRQIAENNAIVNKAEAQMNQRILNIQSQFDEQTAERRERNVSLEKNVELYCIEHRDEFVGSKTIALNFGLVSFRLSTPKLTTLRGFTWDTALSLLRKLKMTEFIRVKEEVDKDMVKERLTDAKDLASIGLQVQQTEGFYYEVYNKEIK